MSADKSHPSARSSVLTRLAARVARFWGLGKLALGMSHILGRILPGSIWTSGKALTRAAEIGGVESYQELMLASCRLDHTSKIQGDQIVSIYFAFAFHFSFVTGLFFPQFMSKALDNPGRFYLEEVAVSAIVAAGLTYIMIAGRLGTTVFSAFKTANLSEIVEDRWNRSLRGGIPERLRFVLSFLTIPLGIFPGVIKDGLSYGIDGESPLKVSAAGPKDWDRRVFIVVGLLTLPLVVLALLSPSSSPDWLRASGAGLSGFVHSDVHELALRILLPLAVIAFLGKSLIGSGAYKTHIIDRDLARWAGHSRKKETGSFDMTAVKSRLILGEDH